MPELLGKHDVIEDCRRNFIKSWGNYHLSAELILKNGDRRIYRAKAIDKNSAIREIIEFVATIEEATGEQVVWRLRGQKTYQFSTNYVKTSLSQKAKRLINYLFDLD